MSEDVDRIERDRKSREKALALWLLLLIGKSERYVLKAIRVGAPWQPVLRGVVLGNPSLDLPGGVPKLTKALIDTHQAGVRRVGRLADVPVDDTVSDSTMQRYEVAAGTQLERIRQTIEAAILAALGLALPEDKISEDVKQVGTAFDNGWSMETPYAANLEATTAVTQAYASGMGQGYRTPAVATAVKGFRFWNPMDERTTAICMERHNTRLYTDDPYWRTQTPPLHWACRSLLLPIFGKFVPTVNPPLFPPPMPGWGFWNSI